MQRMAPTQSPVKKQYHSPYRRSSLYQVAAVYIEMTGGSQDFQMFVGMRKKGGLPGNCEFIGLHN